MSAIISCTSWKRARGTPTSTPSSESSAVSEERRPSLPWISWLVKPSLAVGTRKQASPLCFFSGSVWAKIRATSEKLPRLIHIFCPLIDQPESVFVVRVRTLEASEPVSGSVSPKQPRLSPEQSFGSQAWFCSSVPHLSIEPATNEVCTETTVRAEESA